MLRRIPDWEYLNLPAISDDGRSLWPERWPLPMLEEKRRRVGEYTFASLFQGRPRPRGGALFGEPHVYENLPNSYRVAIGLDHGYSAKKSADYSVAVVMLESDKLFYVADVVRKQVPAPQFKAIARQTQKAWRNPLSRIYAAGTEKGATDFMQVDPDGLQNLEVLKPNGDKFQRAQPYAAAWNHGRILVPKSSPAWLEAFLNETLTFTGVNDEHDDQVDAAVAAFDRLNEEQVGFRNIPKLSTPRTWT